MNILHGVQSPLLRKEVVTDRGSDFYQNYCSHYVIFIPIFPVGAIYSMGADTNGWILAVDA